MKLHLPSCLRRYLVACAEAVAVAFFVLSPSSLAEDEFTHFRDVSESISGTYDHGISVSNCQLTSIGTTVISANSGYTYISSYGGYIGALVSNSSLLNKGTLTFKPNGDLASIAITTSSGLIDNRGVLNINGYDQGLYLLSANGTGFINSGKLNMSSTKGSSMLTGIRTGVNVTNMVGGEMVFELISTWTSTGYSASPGPRGIVMENAGSFTNHGQVDIHCSGARAEIEGISNGSLENSATGTISIMAEGRETDAYGVIKTATTNAGTLDIEVHGEYSAYGIKSAGLVNREGGVVKIKAFNTGDAVNYRYAYGIQNSSIENAGSMEVAAHSEHNGAYGVSSSKLTNAGKGSMKLDVSAAADSYGVYVGDYFSNEVGGTVDITSLSAEKRAYGVYAYLNDGVFHNAGELNVGVDGKSSAWGTYIQADFTNEATTGKLTVKAVSDGSSCYGGCFSGAVSNYGILDYTALGKSNVYGHYYGYSSDCIVTNHEGASITIKATSEEGDSYGICSKSGTLTNDGHLTLTAVAEGTSGNAIGMDLSGTVANYGTMCIEAEGKGKNTYGIKNQAILINHGTLDISSSGNNSYGVYHSSTSSKLYNNGNLRTDSIYAPQRYSDTYLMNGSTTGAFTENKALSLTGNTSKKATVHLGGALGEDYAVSAVEGGSRVNISSSLEISALNVNLQDDVTLAMGGDLAIGSNVSTTRNEHRFLIDNGDTAHTVTYGSLFSASWDHTLELMEDGVAWDSSLDMPKNLTLESGTLNVYGMGNAVYEELKSGMLRAGALADYKAPDITLKSGSLNLTAAEKSCVALANNTITWNASDATTPVLNVSLASGTQHGEMTWDADTVKFNFQKVNTGSLLLSLNVSDDAAEEFYFVSNGTPYSLYTTVGSFFNKRSYWNYNGLSKIISKSPTTEWYQKGVFANQCYNSVVVFNGDMYSAQQTTSTHRLLGTKTYRGDTFITYDTEKYSYSESLWSAGDKIPDDKLNCGLIAGMHMAMTWLDKYAPLGNAGNLMPQVISNEHGVFTLQKSAATLGTSSVYDFLCGYYPGGTSDPVDMVSWILTGKTVVEKSMKGRMADYTSEAPFYAAGLPKWTCVSVETDGSFTEESVEYGKIYGMNVIAKDGVISNVGSTLTQIIKAAFSEKSSAPMALGYNQVSISSGETGGHAVTCYGYDTSIIEGVEYVTKLWLCDSDDYSAKGNPHVVSCDIIYSDDGRAYLANLERPGVINYIATIAFMTDPKGMDDMLNDYYDKNKPIYWTGTNTEWKKDNIGGRESQTRLATLSDGWRKECKSKDDTIWAYTTFSGSKEDVVFGEAVNGATVKKRRITIADNLEVGNIRIEGFGYEWHVPVKRSVKVSAESLIVDQGSLTIRETLCVAATEPIIVKTGTSLKNLGLIDGGVELEAGGTLISGTVQVGDVETASALSEGLFIQSGEKGLLKLNLGTGSLSGGVYTLGTTIDFTGSTISQALLTQLQTGGHDVMNNYVADMFGVDSDSLAFLNIVTNYNLVDDAVNFANTSTRLDGGHVTVSGSLSKTLSLGSCGASREESAANLQLSEQHGAQLSAKELTLATLTGERTLINAESFVESQKLCVVAGSELENNGEQRGRIEVEGILTGSGVFGKTTACDGSSIVIGNSPGAAEYESLTLKNGSEIVFSVDGFTPAAEELSGWGSGAHSVLTLTGPEALTLEDGAEVKIGFSADFLTSAEIGKTLTLALIQGGAADEELLAALQQATSFYYAEQDDSLSLLSESTLYSVHEFSWQAGDNSSIELSVMLYFAGQGAVPEPTTTTLSLLALSMLAARRRRW